MVKTGTLMFYNETGEGEQRQRFVERRRHHRMRSRSWMAFLASSASFLQACRS